MGDLSYKVLKCPWKAGRSAVLEVRAWYPQEGRQKETWTEDGYRMDVRKIKGHREQCQQNERESCGEVE